MDHVGQNLYTASRTGKCYEPREIIEKGINSWTDEYKKIDMGRITKGLTM